MREVFKNKYLARNFFGAVALLLIVLVLLRKYVLTDYLDAEPIGWAMLIAGLSEKVLVSVVVAVGLALVLWYLIPSEEDTEQIQIVSSDNGGVSKRLREEMRSSRSWRYSGGTGTFLSAVTLPVLAGEAHKREQRTEVEAMIIDPREDSLCEQYALYRAGVKSAKHDAPWTKDHVKNQLLATVIATYVIQNASHYCHFKIRLKNHLSRFRYDMGDSRLFITTESPDTPALTARSGEHYYNSYKEDLQWSFEHADELPSEAPAVIVAEALKKAEDVEDRHIKPILVALGLEGAVPEADYPKVATLVRESRNRYE